MTTITPGERLTTDAANRNREPILEVLRETLPATGVVLEVAAGTGQHAMYFASKLPGLTWQPTELEPKRLASIEGWRVHLGLANVRPVLRLDVTESPWPLDHADAMVAINMLQVVPWGSVLALLDGARRTLPAGAPLYLYGPYRRGGDFTTASNAAFDATLRGRNPDWGLKDLERVEDAAARRGLDLERVVDMPANNFSVVFRRPALSSRER